MLAQSSKNDLVGGRASLQRLKDARIVHGWIESFDRTFVTVRYTSQATDIGQKFLVQCEAVSGSVSFEAVLRSEETVSGNTEVKTIELRRGTYELNGPVTHQPIATDPRYLADGRIVRVGDYEITCRLLDVSPGGLAVSSPVPFPGGTHVTIKMETNGGLLETQAEVRYSRRPPPGEELYRVGMRLLGLDRVSRARWTTLLP